MLSRLLVFALACSSLVAAQQVATPLGLRTDGPVIRKAVRVGEPFTVAGERGVVVGQQEGVFEAWVLPVKVLSHMTIEANVQGYAVPINLNTMAREIEVRPDRTTITYSHIAVVVRQTMFAADRSPDGTGAEVVFSVDSLRPVDLVFRFTGEMRKMWPALSSGVPSAEWVARGASGLYVLHTDFPDFAGAVELPGATPGVMAPYQERPQTHPLELHLHVDPKTDRGRTYPLLMAIGTTRETASTSSLEGKLTELQKDFGNIYAAHAAHYRELEQQFTAIVTPDEALNANFLWAQTSIEQLRARTPGGEVGLVAGYYDSGDSARPGFGWFFGRDALYTLYAIDSYGDFSLARMEFEFLLGRQRADGKMMHEYSQTADQLDWKALPYEYAAADATPLFLTALLDYVKSSGDVAFLTKHRDAVMRAWQFETSHDADGDGIYDNAQGTGWVESWPPGMPKQEIYLALLDEQASRAMGELSELLGDASMSKTARARAATIHQTIEREYYRPAADTYAFSWDAGKQDITSTVYPAIAWWNGGAGLDHAAASQRRWAAHDFATDWGARDVAANDPMFDGMSYHQGSVWPLFTGWAAIAQYRGGSSLAGYQSMMQNVDLTLAQDLGAVTELLSGDFFEPFGRSTSHQLWSSAMVVTPVLRGMFGVSVDALKHEVTVAPHLPAQWNQAEVKRLRVGDAVIDLTFKRVGTAMVVGLRQQGGAAFRLHNATGDGTTLRLPLPAVEIGVGHGLPARGSRTTQMKVLSEKATARSVEVEVEGVGGTEGELMLRRNGSGINPTAEGATLVGDSLHISFGPGADYVTKTVTVRW